MALSTAVSEGRAVGIEQQPSGRSIKSFVIGRKNFLFVNSPRGTQDNAVTYSLIETAKETGLDPLRYLTWQMPLRWIELWRTEQNRYSR